MRAILVYKQNRARPIRNQIVAATHTNNKYNSDGLFVSLSQINIIRRIYAY